LWAEVQALKIKRALSLVAQRDRLKEHPLTRGDRSTPRELITPLYAEKAQRPRSIEALYAVCARHTRALIALTRGVTLILRAHSGGALLFTTA
jgi:hypothetical protein